MRGLCRNLGLNCYPHPAGGYDPAADAELSIWIDAADPTTHSAPAGNHQLTNKAPGEYSDWIYGVVANAAFFDYGVDKLNGLNLLRALSATGAPAPNCTLQVGTVTQFPNPSAQKWIFMGLMKNVQGTGRSEFGIIAASHHNWKFKAADFTFEFGATVLWSNGASKSGVSLLEVEYRTTKTPNSKHMWVDGVDRYENNFNDWENTLNNEWRMTIPTTSSGDEISFAEGLWWENPSWLIGDADHAERKAYLNDKWAQAF